MNTKRKKAPRKKTKKTEPRAFTVEVEFNSAAVPALIRENTGLRALVGRLFGELQTARIELEILRAAHSSHGDAWVIAKED